LDLELKHLLGYARRWWWLLILLPVLAGATAYVMSSRQDKLYLATATLLIRPAQNAESNNDFSALQSGQRLATTYQQLVVTEPVLAPVAELFGPLYSVDVLKGVVTASTVRDTQLLKISVSDTDPARAAQISNAVAAEFASFISEQELASTSNARSGLQMLIDDTQADVEELQQRITTLEGAGPLDDTTQAELDGLRVRISQLEQSLATLLIQAQNLDLDASALQNQVRVYVPATVPSAPYAPRVLFYALIGAFLGALLAAAVVGLLEYLDNTVKASLNYQSLFNAPLLSVVHSIPRLAAGSDQIFVLKQSKSSSAESIRLLRTNVEFAAASREISTMAISSSGPSEGKSTVTANLGAAMAQAGFSTVVIDADLHRPTQHKIFGVLNDKGLTTLLTNPERQWRTNAIETIPGMLWVIPSGPLPPNPSDLLSSERFRTLIGKIRESVDIVLIDTPPVLAVSDPLVVATATDGVILVCRASHTRIEALQRSIEAFPESVRRIGIVLNQQERGNQEDGYYYYGYYGPDESENAPSKRKSWFGSRAARPPMKKGVASGADV
jgi:succinoglycan biosynthesis transport protein ExoP